MHEVAGADAGGVERPRHAEEIRPPRLGLVDRPGRGEDPRKAETGTAAKPPNGGSRRCNSISSDLRVNGSSARARRSSSFGAHLGEPLAIGRAGRLCRRDDRGQRRHQRRLARRRVARLERVVNIGCPPESLRCRPASTVLSDGIRRASAGRASRRRRARQSVSGSPAAPDLQFCQSLGYPAYLARPRGAVLAQSESER